jgi:hypothetical protein
MKWITREKAKVDRVACPWLIEKFIDPQAARAAGTLYQRTGAIVVNPATCFASGLLPPENPDHEYAAHSLDFRLRATADAMDKGLVLPNLNDGYKGKAPDLGALEAGDDLPLYGLWTAPRPIVEGTMKQFRAGRFSVLLLACVSFFTTSRTGACDLPQPQLRPADRREDGAGPQGSGLQYSMAGKWHLGHADKNENQFK